MDGKRRGEWVAGDHAKVLDFSACELSRVSKRDKEEVTKYYNKLRFKVKFPEKKRFYDSKPI